MCRIIFMHLNDQAIVESQRVDPLLHNCITFIACQPQHLGPLISLLVARFNVLQGYLRLANSVLRVKDCSLLHDALLLIDHHVFDPQIGFLAS